jgi:hypothetical protein
MLKNRLSKDYNRLQEATKHTDGDFGSVLRILSDASEFDELPVRHNGFIFMHLHNFSRGYIQ